MNEMRLQKVGGILDDIYLQGSHIARFTTVDKTAVARMFCESVRQQIYCMLKTEEAEAFSNLEYGIPWFGRILNLPTSFLDVACKIIREKISQIPGVREVVQIKLNAEGRNISGTFKIRTNDGLTAEGSF